MTELGTGSRCNKDITDLNYNVTKCGPFWGSDLAICV